MKDEKVERIYEKFLRTFLALICPWDVETESKISKLFVASIFFHCGMLVFWQTYIFVKWEEMNLTSLTEISAASLGFLQQFTYLCMMPSMQKRFTYLVGKIIVDRKSKGNEDQRAIGLAFCKIELLVIILYLIVYVIFCIAVSAPIDYRQPFNFYFELPRDHEMYIVNWLPNYLFHLATLACLALFYVPHLFLIILTANHSAFMVDSKLLVVDRLEKLLKNKVTDEKSTKDALREVVEAVQQFLDWQNNAGSLLQPQFFVQLTLQSVILCMCFNTVLTNFSGTVFVFCEMLVCIAQLFVYCWMGSRVISRIEKLSNAVYNIDWRLLRAKQQKDVQFVLMMTHNIRGYNGIFKEVSLKSFKEIMEFSYTILAVLRTMN